MGNPWEVAVLDDLAMIAHAQIQPTAPLSNKQVEAILNSQNVQYEAQQLIAAFGQSVGKQREHNEDSLVAITATLAGNAASVPFGLYVVADGMGGHQFGEVASNAAIRVLAGQIMRKFHSFLFNMPTQQPENHCRRSWKVHFRRRIALSSAKRRAAAQPSPPRS